MSFKIHHTIIARMPMMNFIEQLDIDKIRELIEDATFMEAIYLASPILYNECIKWKEGNIQHTKEEQKIIISLAKYAQRMYSRCTPFGLFAGCTTLKWAEQSQWHGIKNKWKKTRLDMHYLCALAANLAKKPFIQPYLLFYPNTSCYTIANELRYIDYHYKHGKRKHSMSAVEQNEHLQKILLFAKKGATKNSILHYLVSLNISVKDSTDYINDLIENQILVSELEPALTGEGFLQQIIKILSGIPTKTIHLKYVIQKLYNIEKIVEQIETNTSNTQNEFLQLQKSLKELEVAFEENKLIQTDLFFETKSTVNEQFKNQINETFQFFQKYFAQTSNPHLQNFIKKFNERYEGLEMPLLNVLDTVTGIGYTDVPPKSITPLIENIIPQYKKFNFSEYRLSTTHEALLKKLIKATNENVYTISISDEDFNTNEDSTITLPPSINCMCKIVNNETLFIEHFSGTSAANLLGRFCYGNKDMNQTVLEITNEEQYLNEEIIFAEIIHLPESRIGNILQHPPFRRYEIPYLGSSSMPIEQQITLDDLLISVRNDTIILRSKKLGKTVIPRLSNAHNYSYNALPIYQFLCDLQSQQLSSGLSFHWGELAGFFPFLPRVMYKNTMISEATWNWDIQRINDIKDYDYETFCAFATKQKMPQYSVLADGDNELLVDLKSKLSVEVLLATIKNRQFVQLKEFRGYQKENTFPINELIVPLIQQKPVYHHLSYLQPLPVPNCNIPGSQWIYYKLYCGADDADMILTKALLPLLETLEKENFLKKWFFIRYNDPHFHIRFRLQINHIKDMGQVLSYCTPIFESFTQQSLLWKVQLDTYQKEQNRYTAEAMCWGETVFSLDSITTIKFLKCKENETNRWLFALQKVNALLNAFNYNNEQKRNLLTRLKKAFNSEHKLKKIQLQEINKKYKRHHENITDYYNKYVDLFEKQTRPIAQNIIDIMKENNQSTDDVLTSYIHMMLNRIFITSPRLHEAVLYEFLYQYYTTLLHKMKNYVEQ